MFSANASTFAPGDAQGVVSDQNLYKVAPSPSGAQSALLGIAGLVLLIWILGRQK